MTANTRPNTSTPRGRLVEVDGEAVYEIADVDRLPPFLMTLVSESDHWLFLSSTGALTAGRGDAENALFPYETEDRIHRSVGRTGPFTLLRCAWLGADADAVLWEPFTGPREVAGRRSLYKTPLSDRVRFEETRDDLGLTFAYEWGFSDEYGFVRRATLSAAGGGDGPLTVSVLDGLRYLLPAGLGTRLQQTASVLGDAYKHNELDPQTGLGIYSLTALVVDRPEPAESLRATVAWSTGLPAPTRLLSTDQLGAFRAGASLRDETLTTGRPGDYLVASSFVLEPGKSVTWHVIADVERSQPRVVELAAELEAPRGLAERLHRSVADNRRGLRAIVASADGLQSGADPLIAGRHAANVLFNCMRGGVFAESDVPVADLDAFVGSRNRLVHAAHHGYFDELPRTLSRARLLEAVEERGDPDLYRLCAEYLPLTFSRRHGDPSRPWNRFRIGVRHADGSRRLDYEGNWRDVFQNWEALLLSFPEFLEATVALFVNASTIDGFNPYRLTRAGFEWEVPDPDDPWAHIGYWGDHQIIYLLKLLEWSGAHHEGALRRLSNRAVFAYADVPYRLKPYENLVADPHHTIDYDSERARQVAARVDRLGADGRLVHDADGHIVHVTLAEKLLVPLLSKLSNLVVDGGIWMNTQRPEWNDANNALVGFGISMVTHAYLHRYVSFCLALFDSLEDTELALSAEIAGWLTRVAGVLARERAILAGPTVGDADRRRVLDGLGGAFSDYRARVYRDGLSPPVRLPMAEVRGLLGHARAYLEHGLRASHRDDGLFQAYSLLDLSAPGRATVEPLWPMLEGQVAVLSTALLEADEVVGLVDRLYTSPLYRADQDTFLLYPARTLPRFLERNVVPAELVEQSALLTRLVETGDGRILVRDVRGDYRFDSDLHNARELESALAALSADPRFAELVGREHQRVLEVWEAVFQHRSFTGRSGTMYGYEGLGSVYWHMVSKLLLAVQERFFAALDGGSDQATLRALAERYYRVRGGLGFNKTVAEYGAFPTDPYSHTPSDGQARQPGMTGQVKEDILARRGELGVRVQGGRLGFEPLLLRRRELLTRPRPWPIIGLDGATVQLSLPAHSLGFTVCQVPVVYRLSERAGPVELTWASGERQAIHTRSLERPISALVFERSGAIERIDVPLATRELLLD